MDRESQRLAQQSMAFVLAGGRGSRLYELTERRAKPAMYFGGHGPHEKRAENTDESAVLSTLYYKVYD